MNKIFAEISSELQVKCIRHNASAASVTREQQDTRRATHAAC